MPYALWIGGAAVAGWLFKEAGDAADSAAKLGKIVVIGGVVYVGYRALVK